MGSLYAPFNVLNLHQRILNVEFVLHPYIKGYNIINFFKRISQIFRVKSARKLNLTDRVLAQRLVPIVLVGLVAVTLWTAVGSPQVTWRRTSNTDLKFKDCAATLWEYGILICQYSY